MRETPDSPDRRELLTLTLRAAALPGGAQFLAAWLEAADEHGHAAHEAPPELPLLQDYRPKFFNPEDFSALQAFTEILIPADDTPGARQARCAYYIDFLLDSAAEYAPEMQTQWRRAMEDLRQAGFHAAGAKERAMLVEAMSRPERDPGARHPAFDAYGSSNHGMRSRFIHRAPGPSRSWTTEATPTMPSSRPVPIRSTRRFKQAFLEARTQRSPRRRSGTGR